GDTLHASIHFSTCAHICSGVRNFSVIGETLYFVTDKGYLMQAPMHCLHSSPQLEAATEDFEVVAEAEPVTYQAMPENSTPFTATVKCTSQLVKVNVNMLRAENIGITCTGRPVCSSDRRVLKIPTPTGPRILVCSVGFSVGKDPIVTVGRGDSAWTHVGGTYYRGLCYNHRNKDTKEHYLVHRGVWSPFGVVGIEEDDEDNGTYCSK
ncbi:hypothetical protein KIPB_010953, partial [Kipferlia bialata]